MARAKKQIKVEENVQPPLLGAMSNLFRGSPEQVAGLFVNYGLDAVQILPNFPGMRISTAADVTTTICEEMGAPFQEQDLYVAAVTAHTNFLDPDKSRRSRMVKRFDALIEHCHAFGTSHLVTESSTLNPEHPWEDFAENHSEQALAQLIKAMQPSVKLAEKAGVKILIEGYLFHVVSTPAKALKLREELGDVIGFVMDPPNYFTRSMTSSPKKSLRTLFEALGPFSPLAHGKDVRYTGGTHTTPRAGSGSLDYKEFLELLDEYQPDSPLIFEQIRPEELRETIDFVDRFFQ